VPRREIALLTFIIGAGIAPQLFREGLQNQQAWGWALVSVLMVAALWRCLRVRKADLLQLPALSRARSTPIFRLGNVGGLLAKDYQALADA
jgi:hypothetical protein